eukprot:13009387-Ditylum_brightwellii.AAC.1
MSQMLPSREIDMATRLFIVQWKEHVVIELQWKSWMFYYVHGLKLPKKKPTIAARPFMKHAFMERSFCRSLKKTQYDVRFLDVNALMELQWKMELHLKW